MPRDASFWRNVAIIGIAHVAVLAGLKRWSGQTTKPPASEIIWMDGAETILASTQHSLPLPPEPEPAPSPPPKEQEQTLEPEEAVLTPAVSEIQMPTPASTVTPRPAVTPKPSPTATPKPSPTRTPKPTPKKALLAKASPRPAVKKTVETKKDSIKPGPDEIENNASAGPSVASTEVGNAAGSGGRGTGAGGASQISSYGNMLHARFFSAWVQPKSAVMSGAKMSALVKIRIEKDGRVSDFAIVKSSGNVVVDESVAAVAPRVTQVDPLPTGVGSGGSYSVNINFELDPE